MRDSACRWLIVENAKIFRSYVKHFEVINNLKRNGQKQFKRNRLIHFSFPEEGTIKRCLNFAVFKLLVVLSITKLYIHDVTF